MNNINIFKQTLVLREAPYNPVLYTVSIQNVQGIKSLKKHYFVYKTHHIHKKKYTNHLLHNRNAPIIFNSHNAPFTITKHNVLIIIQCPPIHTSWRWLPSWWQPRHRCCPLQCPLGRWCADGTPPQSPQRSLWWLTAQSGHHSSTRWRSFISI